MTHLTFLSNIMLKYIMIFYITRHGETEYNILGQYCGSTDISLNETGLGQACDLAQRLQGMRFDAVISSPMLRARQTAEIACAALGMHYSVYEQFAERNMGVYEGLTKDEAKGRYPHLWNRQCTIKPDDAPDGGETIRQVCARIEDGLAQLRYQYNDKTILLICHGFVARAVNRYFCNLSFEEMASFTLGNCEVVKYCLNPV